MKLTQIAEVNGLDYRIEDGPGSKQFLFFGSHGNFDIKPIVAISSEEAEKVIGKKLTMRLYAEELLEDAEEPEVSL